MMKIPTHLGDAGHHLAQALAEGLGDGVHVVGDAAEHVARLHLVKVGQRQAVDLLADLLAHGVAHLGGHSRHQPALHAGKAGAEQIQPAQSEQDTADGAEVDGAGAGELGDDAGGQLGGGLAGDLGTHHHEHGGSRRKHQAAGDGDLEPAQIFQQFADGAFKVFCLFPGHHAPGPAAHGTAGTDGVFMLAHANSSFESWLSAISR